MPTWSDLLDELKGQPNDKKNAWLNTRLDEQLTKISQRRGHNVIVYVGFPAKAFRTFVHHIDQS